MISEKLRVIPIGIPQWFHPNGLKLYQDVCDLKGVNYYSKEGLKIRQSIIEVAFFIGFHLSEIVESGTTITADEVEELEEIRQKLIDDFKALGIAPDLVEKSTSTMPHPNDIEIFKNVN